MGSSFQAADINIGLPNGGIAVLNFNGDPFNLIVFYGIKLALMGRYGL